MNFASFLGEAITQENGGLELLQLYLPSPSSCTVNMSGSDTEMFTLPRMKFSLPDLTNTENLLKLDLVVAALTFLPEVLTSPVLALSCWGAAGWRK